MSDRLCKFEFLDKPNLVLNTRCKIKFLASSKLYTRDRSNHTGLLIKKYKKKFNFCLVQNIIKKARNSFLRNERKGEFFPCKEKWVEEFIKIGRVQSIS